MRVSLIILILIGAFTAEAAPGFTPMNPPAAFKPSDIFFGPVNTSCNEVDLNNKEAPFIIAKDIEIRGWLTGPSKNGREDYHYDLVPDFDWILDSNSNPTLQPLESAVLFGHASTYNPLCIPRHFYGITTKTLPFKDLVPADPSEIPCFERADPTTCLSRGITANSFLLPGNFASNFVGGSLTTPLIHPELNAYWSDVRNDLSPAILAVSWPDPENTNTFYAYNPGNPDGTGPLQAGDYIRMKGTLWQDVSHEHNCCACYDQGSLNGYGGWIEMHPPDLIERNPSRTLTASELDDLLNGRITTAPSANVPINRYSILEICVPEGPLDQSQIVDTRIVPTIPRPSPKCHLHVTEFIDGRLTDKRNFDQYLVTVTDDPADPHVDVHLRVFSSGTLSGHGRPGHFKAVYKAWWDCGCGQPDADLSCPFGFVWVDFNFPCTPCGDGSFDNPFNSLLRSALNVPPSGTIFIKSGVSSELLTITNSSTLQAYGGPATIGR